MKQAYTFAILAVHACTTSLSGQWVAEAPIPADPFDGGYGFAHSGRVYVGSENELNAYDPVSGTWEAMADFPGSPDRTWATAFVIGSKAYVGLGLSGTSTFHNDLWAYDPALDSWSARASLPGAARGGVAVFVIGTDAYLCGGTSTGPTFSDVYKYNSINDTWTLVSAMPTGTRGFPAAFAIGNYGYVYGGYQGFGNETNQLHRYDPITDMWAQMAAMPGPGRQSAIGVTVNGKGVVGLGHSGFTTGYNSFYSYDPITNQWTAWDTFPGSPRVAPLAVVLDGTVFVHSGAQLSNFALNNDWWSHSGLVGVDEPTTDTARLISYPTIAETTLTIDLPEANGATLTVCDPLGRMVSSAKVSGARANLNVTELAPGSYRLSLITADGRRSSSTFVKP